MASSTGPGAAPVLSRGKLAALRRRGLAQPADGQGAA